MVEDWQAHLFVADNPARPYNPYLQTNKRRIWETADTSLPIPIGDNLWFVRVMTHKLDGLCIDIRQYKEENDGVTKQFIPTETGIVLPLKEIGRILDAVLKLLKKWRKPPNESDRGNPK